MIKISCNICEKEIEQNQIAGQMNYVEKTLLPENSVAQPVPPQIKQMLAHFCEPCLEKVKKIMK